MAAREDARGDCDRGKNSDTGSDQQFSVIWMVHKLSFHLVKYNRVAFVLHGSLGLKTKAMFSKQIRLIKA